jgi:hypothetical protein
MSGLVSPDGAVPISVTVAVLATVVSIAAIAIAVTFAILATTVLATAVSIPTAAVILATSPAILATVTILIGVLAASGSISRTVAAAGSIPAMHVDTPGLLSMSG